MKGFLSAIRISFVALACFTILLGIIYPCFIWGIGQLFFHKKANGSLLMYQNGEVIGSSLIGQNFTLASYFHPRPSSAGDKGYDAANSSGSNLGPTSQKLIDTVRSRVAAYRAENSLGADVQIPPDAVTCSGSGLDPHISLANAMLQAPRVASARGMTVDEVRQLIGQHTEGRSMWLFGEKRVNVLRLNLALDKTAYSE